MTWLSASELFDREARLVSAVAPFLPPDLRQKLDGVTSRAKRTYGKLAGYLAKAESAARAVGQVADALGLGAGPIGTDPSVTPPGTPLLSLDDFVFSAGRAAHQTLERAVEYRWAQQDRLLRRPAMQWTGHGKETIRLAGVIYTRYSLSTGHLEALRRMAAQGEPYELVGGDGTLYGLYVITSVQETGSELDDQGLARVIEFTLELSAYGEDQA